MFAPHFLAAAALVTACSQAAPPRCAGWSQPQATGVVQQAALTEASGLVASRARADLLWTHNDSGSGPVLYALGADGRSRGSLALTGVASVDWEDLALGVDASGGPALYVGDIGDNERTRSSVVVWRVAEPAEPDGDQPATAEALTLSYPDGPLNAEGLGFDPRTNDLVLATKEKQKVRLYRASGLAAAGSSQVLELVGELALTADAFDGGRRVTAMDFSPTGDRLYLRTKTAVLVLDRQADDLSQALAGGGCLAPAPDEPDGEAIAAFDDGFYTVSEGPAPTLWRVEGP